MDSVRVKDIHGNYEQVPLSKLRWRPSAYAVVIHDGAVVVVPDNTGRYDLPGGGIELGEMPEQAVLREAHEETGLTLQNPRLLDVKSSFFKMPDKPDDYIQSFMMYYVADIASGRLTDEYKDAHELAHTKLAEWLPLTSLDTIGLTSSIDWRPIVHAAAR